MQTTKDGGASTDVKSQIQFLSNFPKTQANNLHDQLCYCMGVRPGRYAHNRATHPGLQTQVPQRDSQDSLAKTQVEFPEFLSCSK